jgi:hypothetical protein
MAQGVNRKNLLIHRGSQYSKHAKVTLPSLDDWEKGWEEKLKAETLKPEMPEPKVSPADFRAATEATQNRGATDALAFTLLN